MHLITTALENTWPSKNEKVVFLGEWCRLYNSRDRWSRFNAKVLPYHWDNRKKLYKDYYYLQNLYERILIELSISLNEIHNVNHSTRYWKIVIGPWLGYFIKILFDRWTCIQQANDTFSHLDTIIIDYDKEDFIPKNTAHFHTLFEDDPWNHFIYSEIIQGYSSINYSKSNVDENNYTNLNKNPPESHPRKYLYKFFNIFLKDNDAVFFNTKIDWINLTKLYLSFKQVPQFWYLSPLVSIPPNMSSRNWQLNMRTDTKFEEFLCEYIPLQIPTVYLEGYHKLLQQMSLVKWPKHPKYIFTFHLTNELFKVWVSEKVESNVPLVVAQHGSGPFHKLNARWQNDIDVSNYYFTTGKGNQNISSKMVDVGQLFNMGQKNKYNPNGALTLVEVVMPRYSFDIRTMVIAGQNINYFEEQFIFVNNLSPRIIKKTNVRLYKQDYGWHQKERWRNKFPKINLDNGRYPLQSLVRNSRLVVCTYAATTYNIYLSLNIPVVIFWNPLFWELHESSNEIFKNLKRARIYHDNPESAAKHVNEIWSDVDKWWSSNSVQRARKEFCRNYAFLPNDLNNRLVKELKIVVNENSKK